MREKIGKFDWENRHKVEPSSVALRRSLAEGKERRAGNATVVEIIRKTAETMKEQHDSSHRWGEEHIVFGGTDEDADIPAAISQAPIFRMTSQEISAANRQLDEELEESLEIAYKRTHSARRRIPTRQPTGSSRSK